MTTLLIILIAGIGGADPNEVMLPKAIHMMFYRDVVVSVDVTDANEVAPHKWNLKGDVTIMTYPQALSFMARKWTAPMNLHDFVFLARSWPQPVTTMAEATIIKSDPNAIEKPVCYRIAGCKTCKRHLYLSCPAIYGKEWELVEYEPNVCLTCLSRKLKEQP